MTAFQSINIKATSAEFTWNTQCVDMALLEAYVISYCRVGVDVKLDCHGKYTYRQLYTCSSSGTSKISVIQYKVGFILLLE